MKYPQLPNPFEDMPRRSFMTGGRGGRSKIASRGCEPVPKLKPSDMLMPGRYEVTGLPKRKRGRPRNGEKK